jgi:anti-sigma B factor antagonist
VIAPDGDLDTMTVPRARSQVQEGFAERPERLIIDLSEVTFLSSAGPGMLVYAHTEAERTGARLSLILR